MSGAMGENGAIPRVAHRHMYLWIEDQIEARERVTKGLTTIESLDRFYNDVRVANEGNKFYNFNKLQELVAKAPPYSLLYNKTLNLSTNVLKRWNRSNGMINWFLRKICRGPPSADEVIQVARVHLARSVIKRGDYTTPLLQHMANNDGGSHLGKRVRAEDGSIVDIPSGTPASFGPPPVRAANETELYEVLHARYEGKITAEAVADAVAKDVWHFENGTYVLNTRKLDDWSVGNSAWQHFSEHIQETQVKHDQFLFDFGPDKATAREHKERDRQREKQRDKQRFREKMGLPHQLPYDLQAGSSSSSSLDRASYAPPSIPTHLSRYSHGGYHPSDGGMLPPPSQRPRYNPPPMSSGSHGSRPPWSMPFSSSPKSIYRHALTLYELFDTFQHKLVRKILACQSVGLEIKLLGARLHQWDEVDINEWTSRTLVGTEIFVLFPYFMRMESMEDESSPPTAAMLGHPVAARAQQVAVYTFEYGDDRYLVICAYLVATGRESRFFTKYLLTTKSKLTTPYGFTPVTLGVSGDPTVYMHSDDVKSFKLWQLAEMTLATAQLGGQVRPPRDLSDMLLISLVPRAPSHHQQQHRPIGPHGAGNGIAMYHQAAHRETNFGPGVQRSLPGLPAFLRGDVGPPSRGQSGVPALREAASMVAAGGTHRIGGGGAPEVHRI